MKVEIIADSINPGYNRITTFLLTYPRFIHSEIMTHRVFSRNAASSRAIPIDKVLEQVSSNPATPVRWGKNGKGMQDHGKFEGRDITKMQLNWQAAANAAVEQAKILQSLGLHKQIVNRVLEPFMWMTTLVTATEWENFFSLRVHKDAQPEFQELAYQMLKKYVNNTPEKKQWTEWHIPFGDRMPEGITEDVKLKIATARAARTSYLTMDGKIDVQKDIDLHDSLAANGHWSPFEHAAIALNDQGDRGLPKIGYGGNAYFPTYYGNFIGWKPYRKNFQQENRKCNLNELLENYERERGINEF